MELDINKFMHIYGEFYTSIVYDFSFNIEKFLSEDMHDKLSNLYVYNSNIKDIRKNIKINKKYSFDKNELFQILSYYYNLVKNDKELFETYYSTDKYNELENI